MDTIYSEPPFFYLRGLLEASSNKLRKGGIHSQPCAVFSIGGWPQTRGLSEKEGADGQEQMLYCYVGDVYGQRSLESKTVHDTLSRCICSLISLFFSQN